MFLFTTLQNGAASPAPSAASASGAIEAALQQAADTTGADFGYLLATAKRESSLDPQAKASTSSATGLFQFIDSTWMQMVKEEGASAGLSAYADAIRRTPGGGYAAGDAATRQSILALRSDAALSAHMAGALAQRNRDSLTAALGRAPSNGELYIAHFMGAGGAAGLIRLAATDPGANAAGAFPAQAAANPSIFYTAGGKARSAADVYAALVAPFDAASSAAPSVETAPQQEAEDTGSGAWLGVPWRRDTADATGGSPEPGQPFQSLFRTDAASPISTYVAATWSALGPATATAAAQAAAPAPVQVHPGKASEAPLPPLAPSAAAAAAQDDPEPTLFSGLGSFLAGVFAASQAAPPAIGKGEGP